MAAMAPACGSDPPVAVGAVGQAIRGGSPDTSHPEVAAVLADNDAGQLANLCSGVLVAPTFVLTSAHCLLDANGLGWPPGSLTVRFGADLGAPTARAGVLRASAHPRYMPPGPESTYDVGVLELGGIEGTLPEPAVLGLEPALLAGAAAVIAGYGRTSADAAASGVRYVADQTITTTTLLTLRHRGVAAPCDGDSGGPLFVAGTLTGLIAVGRPTCDGEATSTRLSAVRDFADAVLRGDTVTLAPESCSACVERTSTGSGVCADAYKMCVATSSCGQDPPIDEALLESPDAGGARDALVACACDTGCSDACGAVCGRGARPSPEDDGCETARRPSAARTSPWSPLLLLASVAAASLRRLRST